MKIREYDAYKAVYCTLCKQLRKDYGFLARFTLNFDYTFLAMIRMAAIRSPVRVCKGHCPFNPFAKCNYVGCEDDSLSFAAAVAMLMLYYKLKDTRQDEGFFKRLPAVLCTPLASHWRKKAAKRYPALETVMQELYARQALAEQSASSGLDGFAHPTAHALSQIFSYEIENDSVHRILSAIGYNVGKWVYLIDGLDDWKKDKQRHRFNPYVCRLGESASAQEVADFAAAQLNVCMDEACLAFALLPKKNFHPILENILVLGLEQVQNEVIRKVKSNE